MANKTMLQWNTERLRAILMNSNLDYKIDGYYDLTQPDSMDESDSGGVWDLASNIADDILEPFQDTADDPELEAGKSTLQSLLYNLMRMFVVAKDDDDGELDCEQLYWAHRGANNALICKNIHPDWDDKKIIDDTVDYLKNIAKGDDDDENK